MCPDTQESVQIDSPFPDEFHEDRSTSIVSRSSWHGRNLSQSLAEFLRKRRIVFSTIIYPRTPCLVRAGIAVFKTISSTGDPRNARFDIPVVSESSSITKDAKVSRIDGIHIRTIRKVSSRREMVICRYTRARTLARSAFACLLADHHPLALVLPLPRPVHVTFARQKTYFESRGAPRIRCFV